MCQSNKSDCQSNKSDCQSNKSDGWEYNMNEIVICELEYNIQKTSVT